MPEQKETDCQVLIDKVLEKMCKRYPAMTIGDLQTAVIAMGYVLAETEPMKSTLQEIVEISTACNEYIRSQEVEEWLNQESVS